MRLLLLLLEEPEFLQRVLRWIFYFWTERIWTAYAHRDIVAFIETVGRQNCGWVAMVPFQLRLDVTLPQGLVVAGIPLFQQLLNFLGRVADIAQKIVEDKDGALSAV